MTDSVYVGPGSEARSKVDLCFAKVVVLYCLFDFMQIESTMHTYQASQFIIALPVWQALFKVILIYSIAMFLL